VIVDSVRAYLARRSYNDTDDVAGALREAGLPPRLIVPHANNLQAMIRRRHHIAHRLDRNETPGRGHHVARSIDRATVERWADVVERFGLSLIRGLAPLPQP
jgi:hypothetical protein